VTVEKATRTGTRVARRLRSETIVWLTTVRQDGMPQPSPVWFLWDGSEFLIYSQPKKPKLRNIKRNKRVALHLNSDESGGEVAAFAGEARIDSRAPSAKDVPEYVEKYARGIRSIGMDPDSFSKSYSVAIRVRPTTVRAW
jgi:PPOX class probable F420-dependent enzyme